MCGHRRGTPTVTVPGLVEDQRVDVGGALEKIGALDEDAKARGDGHRGDDRGRPGHDERRRRGDDEHGDGARQIFGEEQRRAGHREHERQPHAGAPLEQPQHRDRGALDVGQQLHHAAQHRVGAGAAHLNSEQTVERHGSGETPGCPARRPHEAIRP